MIDDETTDPTEEPSEDAPPAPEPREKPKRGPRFKLTPELRAQILQAMEAGHHKSVVAGWVGVHPRTLDRLIQDAEEAYRKKMEGLPLTKRERDLCQFCLDFRKSEARPEVAAVGVLAEAIKAKNVKAAIAFLERRYGSRWRRRLGNVVENAPVGGDSPAPDAPTGRLAVELSNAVDASGEAREAVLKELTRRGYDVSSLLH